MTKAEFMAERYAAGAHDGICCEDETICPCCNNGDIECENVERDGDEIGYYYECSECGFGWYVWYKLTYVESCGFIDLDD